MQTNLGYNNVQSFFLHQAQRLQCLCEQLPDPASLPSCHDCLRELHASLSRLEPEADAVGRRLITEIHRLLRLLSKDLMFYQAARSTAVKQERLQALTQHLQQLLDLSQHFA